MLKDNQGLPESDFWALGVILYRLTFGKCPFEGTHENLTFQKILNREIEFPQGAEETTTDLVDKLLKVDPNERISFENLQKHPYFNGI